MTDPTHSPIRPDVAKFLDYINALPGPKSHELPPETSRAMFRAMRDLADAPVGDLAVIRDLEVPATHGTIRVRLYDARETRAPGPVMVFFHSGGGAWCRGGQVSGRRRPRGRLALHGRGGRAA